VGSGGLSDTKLSLWAQQSFAFWSSENSIKGAKDIKLAAIEAAVDKGNVVRVAEMCAERGGLQSDFIRRKAWPLLLEAGGTDPEEEAAKSPKRGTPRAQLLHEFHMDIERSMFHFSCDKSLPRDLRVLKREALTAIILYVLKVDARLHYYQGFHDVATVHLHVSGNDIRKASRTVLAASRLQFADHHQRDFGTTIQVMNLLPLIIQHFDQKVGATLLQAEVGPMFALAWVLTGFAHSVDDLDVTSRLYDIILASHPLLCLYLAAALVLRPTTRARLLKVAEEDCSMPTIHHFLQNIPPPTAPLTAKNSWAKRNEKYEKVRKRIADRLASSGMPVSGAMYCPETRHEEEENCVDNLVESALVMMARLPPSKLVRLGERQDNPIIIPKESSARLPMDTRPAWQATMRWGTRRSRALRWPNWAISHPAATTAVTVAAMAMMIVFVWTPHETKGFM